MAERLSIYASDDVQPHSPNLFPCPDCGRSVSKAAEACPGCGRFFQNFRVTPFVTVDRKGWVWTIAGGIWWSVIFPWLVIIGLIVLLLVMGGVGSRFVPRERESPLPPSQRSTGR